MINTCKFIKMIRLKYTDLSANKFSNVYGKIFGLSSITIYRWEKYGSDMNLFMFTSFLYYFGLANLTMVELNNMCDEVLDTDSIKPIKKSTLNDYEKFYDNK